MPIGVPQGQAIEIVVQFSDTLANPVLPPPQAVSLNIAYTAINGSTAAAILAMSQLGFGYTAIWNSSVSQIGTAVVSFTVGPTTLSPPDPLLRITLNT